MGRQVIIPDVKDRLDILTLDPKGNALIIELKRGELSDPVEMQALRYASDISKRQFEDFENQARNHLSKAGDTDFTFNDAYEQFCTEAGIDDVPDVNTDQRIIMVGSAVRDRLGDVALRLRNHNIEVEVYRESDTLFIQPGLNVPLPTTKFNDPATGPGARLGLGSATAEPGT